MHCLKIFERKRGCQGFTLIEVLVAISIFSVFLIIVAPSFQDFFIKNRIRRISDDFHQSIFKAKNTAVSKNTCAVMCMSGATSSGSLACATGGSDWQPGWMVFLNASCDYSRNLPENSDDILEIRSGIGNDYVLQSQSSTPTRKIMFTARGIQTVGNADEFDLIYKDVSNKKNETLGLNICLDALGRLRNIPHSNTCKNYK